MPLLSTLLMAIGRTAAVEPFLFGSIVTWPKERPFGALRPSIVMVSVVDVPAWTAPCAGLTEIA